MMVPQAGAERLFGTRARALVAEAARGRDWGPWVVCDPATGQLKRSKGEVPAGWERWAIPARGTSAAWLRRRWTAAVNRRRRGERPKVDGEGLF